MDLMNPGLILAQAATQPNPTAQLLQTVGMFVAFGVIFYVIAIRPQQQRAKQQAQMLKSIKSGDKIATTGGILGTVITVKEKSLTIRSADTKMEITKGAVGEILERSGDSAES